MSRSSRVFLAIQCYLLLVGGWVMGGGPAPSGQRPQPGLLVMAHGGDSEWNSAVDAAVAALEPAYPVALALGMAQPESLQRAVEQLESAGVTHIAVVRLFVSPESFREQIEYLLRLRQEPPTHFVRHEMGHAPHAAGAIPMSHDQIKVLPASMAPQPIRIHSPVSLNQEGLYDSEGIGRILVDRVRSLSTSPERESVLILAHGEGDEALNQRWQERLEKLSTVIEKTKPFRDVRVETLREDWYPERAEAERRIRAYVETQNGAGGRVLVVPFRVFGFGPYATVLEGLDFVSDGKGLLPHQGVTDWIGEQAEECFRRLGVLSSPDRAAQSWSMSPDNPAR